jgi:hypothetical protein
MRARLFIQFIALILLSAIRRTMKKKMPGSHYSVQSLLWGTGVADDYPLLRQI